MIICIDPGHNYSGWNTGACGNGLREQDITFYIADKLRCLLEDVGVTVVMTRTALTTNLGTNNASSLKERYQIANKSKAELFISLHCNAGGGTGVESLVKSSRSSVADLGKKIAANISEKLDLKNRGLKERPELAVLRGANMPAVLIETAFIDNATDAQKLKNNQNDFAQAIFDAVADCHGLTRTIEEYTDPEAIIWELNHRKIISNVDLWRTMLANNSNYYWLARKLVDYIRRKPTGETADKQYTDIESVLWELQHRGIVTDVNLWRKSMQDNSNIYWLCVKGIHYCRTL